MKAKSTQKTAKAAKSPTSSIASPAVTFESLTFSDGTVVALEPSDIVVLVGPNNAGKSVALNELELHIGPAIKQTVINSVLLRKNGTVDQLREFLIQHGRKIRREGYDHYSGFRFNISDQHINGWWKSNIAQFRTIFCMNITTESRIIDSNQQPSIPILDQPPTHPIHVLYADDRVEKRISSYFRRAFGKGLIVFHAGGSQWPLLVGNRPKRKPKEELTSASYNERLRASTVPLSEQGDGMRSFASVILHMLVPNTQSVLLLDEPEAFLHPPQARLLGEFIAKEKPSHAQLFIATHSPDVLQGLLDVAPEHLRVLRIQREGAVNRVKELDKARAKTISVDPLMKYSGVMSGVFHQRVIICESEADSMFYSAVLDLPDVRGKQQPDVLFIHAGGKHRLAALVETLRALDVTVDVIADMDVLNDEEVLKRIVISLGGNWSAIQAQARPLKMAIEQHKPWLNSSEVAKGIREVLKKAPKSGEFPRNLKANINDIFRKASPWDAIKAAGNAAIPTGQPTRQYQKLQKLCNRFGLWIVPVGELEGFCKSEGGHGPRWVQQVIEKHDLTKDTELGPARDFIRDVWTKRN